ncbi:hypothetical protein [Streptomyces sp. NPDC014622]|uniref:hypothetical protein n=1 Tax=Streptomyces sp. NPDC014622 TaxID=3364874 RepID=UPI0036FD46EF
MVLLFLGAPSIVAHRRRVPCLGQVIVVNVIGAFTAADAFLAADTGASRRWKRGGRPSRNEVRI